MAEDKEQQGGNTDQELSSQALVKRWQTRVGNAKKRWEKDFKRMRQNMDFVAGLQHTGQKTIRDARYTNNITIKVINQKTATLYARNPKVDVVKREKMNFQVWDEDPQSLMEALQNAAMSQATVGVAPPEAMAVLLDFQQGKQQEKLMERVGRTLRLTYQYQIDAQRPEFKEQMKQAVTRTIVCGVSYCRPIFFRENTDEGLLNTTRVPHTSMDRSKRAALIMERIEDGEVERSDEQVERLQSMFKSMGASEGMNDETMLAERVEFDFPPATSIIPDTRARTLMEWTGASWIAQEFIVPLEDANAFFGTKIKSGGSEGMAKEYKEESGALIGVSPEDKKDNEYTPLVNIWEVFDYKTKTHCVICEGWKDFVIAPEAITPPVAGFWPIFALTFNRIEVEPGTKASIFPPSDVDLIWHPQKEWNRTRDALRAQRNANAPKYPIRKGALSPEDKEAINNAKPNAVVELANIPPDVPPENFIKPMQVARIDPAVYDTKPLAEDIQYSVGTQEANLGPAPNNVTATVGTIAEQSRITVSSSNVDDLDGFLSRIAKATGEMCLREMSLEIVQKIVGPGAVWPQVNRQDFINEVELKVMAASSGKPNQAINIANFERIAPQLIQSGANPIAVIKEGVKRLDDQLDPMDFFPVPGMGQTSAPAGPQDQEGAPPQGPARNGKAKPRQPLQPGTHTPVPLAAA